MHNHFAFQHLVGDSHWTERIRRRIVQASRYSYAVLITGPDGAGKELIARAIHAHSPRAERPFIPFRCGTLPAAMTSRQLFGHAAGAGKLTRHAALGCLGAAQGGTLLLHEVGDLDLAAQDSLLEVLQQRRLQPIGAARTQSADVRIIATTSHDLAQAARAGRFRHRLLYSLNAIPIQALSLAERLADIAPLARHIAARVTLEQGIAYRALTPAALALLEAYDWPGNVDELESVIEQAVTSTEGQVLDLEDFPDLFMAVQHRTEPLATTCFGAEPVNGYESVPALPAVAGIWPSLAQLEAEHLRATLRRAGQSLAVAARLLGIDDAELRAKLRQHRLRPAGPILPGQRSSVSDPIV